jgi:hypothetical protein
LAIGGTRSIGRFEIVRKSTYASYAEIYKKKLKEQQETAFTNAANVIFGAITTESAGLFQIAVSQATERAKAEIVSTVSSITDVTA